MFSSVMHLMGFALDLIAEDGLLRYLFGARRLFARLGSTSHMRLAMNQNKVPKLVM
jgi:hypothetical protein